MAIPRRVAIGRGIAVIAAWFVAAAAAAVSVTSRIAGQDTGDCQEPAWCDLGVFLAALAFGVWAGLALLIGLGIAIATLAVVTHRIRTGLGAGHLAVGAGFLGGALWATALLVAATVYLAAGL